MITMEKPIEAHPMWANEYWMLKAFFEKDPTIEVGDVEQYCGKYTCTIKTEDPRKAEYLREFIDTKELIVNISDGVKNNNAKIGYLLKDNPLFHDVIDVIDPDTKTALYSATEFEPICIHWFSDDFFSPTGHTATVPAELAKKLFSGIGLNFQTHIEK